MQPLQHNTIADFASISATDALTRYYGLYSDYYPNRLPYTYHPFTTTALAGKLPIDDNKLTDAYKHLLLLAKLIDSKPNLTQMLQSPAAYVLAYVASQACDMYDDPWTISTINGVSTATYPIELFTSLLKDWLRYMKCYNTNWFTDQVLCAHKAASERLATINSYPMLKSFKTPIVYMNQCGKPTADVAENRNSIIIGKLNQQSIIVTVNDAHYYFGPSKFNRLQYVISSSGMNYIHISISGRFFIIDFNKPVTDDNVLQIAKLIDSAVL